MTNQTITTPQANQYFSEMKNYGLSRAWRGYGSAIFFEFGKLDQEQKGEYTLKAEEGWTLLFSDITISYKDDWDKLDKKLASLSSKKLVNINFDDDSIKFEFEDFVLEIDLKGLSNNHWSLNSLKFDGYLKTNSGSFVIEKEG